MWVARDGGIACVTISSKCEEDSGLKKRGRESKGPQQGKLSKEKSIEEVVDFHS